ncbi:protein zwilch homolog isoform X2 [Homarus americanus]|uniref:protein zwilch homolog isoform X2 n=1 Tax=Homarus americanus TaxID=6706 RepID=UPI001C4904BE|nr:protein zwilch homolog isoform X2 [Homarus americanus]
MKDIHEVQPIDIQTGLERLLLKKSEYGEHVVVGEERLIVSREACPAILLPFNKQTPDIILIQRFSQHCKRLRSTEFEDSPSLQSNIRLQVNGQTPAKISCDSIDLDVTGSPLKCSFVQYRDEADLPFTVSLPLSKKKEKMLSYMPICSTKAGLIASNFNLVLSKMSGNSDEHLPLWVVCDGKDAQGTLFIGLQRSEGRMSRTIVTTSGPYQGCENLPSLDHLKMHHIAIGPTKRVESAVEATFDVLNTVEENNSSSLQLICNWKRPLTILSPPAPSASTTASLRIVSSDPRCSAYQIFQELNVLRGFVAGLKSGEVVWFIREGTTTMAQDIEKVFAIIREKGQRIKKEEHRGSEFDLMIESKSFNRRQNMDFTDLLWTVFMRCESYQELKESLLLVFEAVASGEVRPQIHVRNNTQVGSLSRNLMRGQEGLPELSDLTPLHMLIEMGCEKIKRDYINIFQAGELATGEQLSWFVSNCETSPEMIVAQLERLHVALQVAVALRMYLMLPQASLTQFTAQVLNKMKKEEPSSLYSFSFKLETLTVHQLLNSKKASTWELSLCSSQGDFTKTLICHISHTPLIQLSSTVAEQEETVEGGDKDEENEESYFCSFFTTVEDKLIP